MERPRIRSAIVFGLLALACCAIPSGVALPQGTVDLRPTPGAASPGSALLPGAWTRPRILEIATSPPGAALELFYLRRNVQQRFERAEAPARVAIPARIDASAQDAVLVRAVLAGYRVDETVIEPAGPVTRHTIELEALPNRLERFAHRGLGGRATLLFTMRQEVHIQLHEEQNGFRILIPETSLADDAARMFEGLSSELVEEIEPIPIGEDLVIRVTWNRDAPGPDLALHARRWRDPARESSGFAIDLGPPARDAERVMRLRAALDAVSADDVTGCALEWERAMRDRIDASQLARALGASAGDGDAAFRHEAMRRLGVVSREGVVRSLGGAAYRTDAEIEALAASSLAPEIIGYLALLRTAVDALASSAHRDETLRGSIAPEISVADWRVIVDESNRAERACRARGDGVAMSDALLCSAPPVPGCNVHGLAKRRRRPA